MSRKQKTLQKIRQNPSHVSFKDIDKVLTWYGFTCRQPGGGSSHYFYHLRVGGRKFPLTIPYKRPHVGRTYVKDMLAVLDELDEMGWGLEE